MIMHKKRITTKVATPFSLKATVLSHGWHECSPMSWCEEMRCYQIIERHGDCACRVSVIEGKRTTTSVTLRVTIEGAGIDEDFVREVRRRVRKTLNLDRDLSGFYERCRKDPTLYILEKIGAGRTIRSASMAENIIKALCATNVNWTQAVKMINRIAQLGPFIPHFRNLNAWPTPREILRAGERYLIEVCRVGYRADSIMRFCRDVCEGRLDPEALDEQAAAPDAITDDLLALLRSIRGIGPSSAHYLLSFLGRSDRISIDSVTIAHVADTYYKGKIPTNKQIEKIYAKYGNWKQSAWWFEQWLSWDTAKQIIQEAGVSIKKPERRHGVNKTLKRRVG